MCFWKLVEVKLSCSITARAEAVLCEELWSLEDGHLHQGMNKAKPQCCSYLWTAQRVAGSPPTTCRLSAPLLPHKANVTHTLFTALPEHLGKPEPAPVQRFGSKNSTVWPIKRKIWIISPWTWQLLVFAWGCLKFCTFTAVYVKNSFFPPGSSGLGRGKSEELH